MKKYQSHKIVEAAVINSCGFEADGSGWAQYTDTDGKDVHFGLPRGFVRPGMACDPGDYLVRYQPDGYLSWSPKAVFEAGYREIGGTSLAPAALAAVAGPTPAAVEVTVTAPAGKRAEVCHAVGDKKSMFAVTPGQSQTWSVMRGEWIGVAASDTSTVAHKRDNG